jgi:hypothetical protein
MIYRAEYLKPDGRRLWLYGRSPPKIAAPTSPDAKSPVVDAHLRRHPILQEWVIYASRRQNRTFLPSPEDDPLAPRRTRAVRPNCRPAITKSRCSRTAFRACQSIAAHRPRSKELKPRQQSEAAKSSFSRRTHRAAWGSSRSIGSVGPRSLGGPHSATAGSRAIICYAVRKPRD